MQDLEGSFPLDQPESAARGRPGPFFPQPFCPRPSRRLALASAALALLLVGCAHFQAKRVDPAATAEAFQARRLSDPGLQAFLQKARGAKRAPAAWDAETLTLAALYFHPDLRLAQAEAAAAEAAVAVARQRPNPSLSAGPQYNVTSPASAMSPWVVPIQPAIPIETAGKRGARAAQAARQAEAARRKAVAVAWNVRSRVQEALLDLAAARRTASLLDEELALRKELASRAQARFEAGEISRLEANKEQAALEGLRIERTSAEGAARQALSRLASAVGVPAIALEGARIQLPDLTQPPPEIPLAAWRREALTKRPDILAALADYEAAQEALRLEIAKQYPNFDIGPGYEFDQDDSKWGLDLSVTLPIFHHNQGGVAEAEARRRAAAARFLALQARVLGEIDCAEAELRSRRESAAQAAAWARRFQDQARRVRAQRAAGEVSRIETLQAELAAAGGRRRLLQARAALQRSFLALEAALQPAGKLAPLPEPQNPLQLAVTPEQ